MDPCSALAACSSYYSATPSPFHEENVWLWLESHRATALWTSGRCAGLFACGNGAVTMCRDATCTCNTPCHHNQYLQNDLRGRGHRCPPALPSPPLPPPLPPAPPLPPPPTSPSSSGHRSGVGVTTIPAACEKWCYLKHAAHAAARSCRCAACPGMDGAAPRLPEGAHCKYHQEHELTAPTAPPPPPRA